MLFERHKITYYPFESIGTLCQMRVKEVVWRTLNVYKSLQTFQCLLH